VRSGGAVRVQKYLSQAGAASRRQAEAMLLQGRVAVNGKRLTRLGARVVPGVDVVSLDGEEVRPASRRWVAFHKPVGVLCTRRDPHGCETVYDVLPSWAARLRYVGRLDRDTSGLLLMTNDGDLAAALAHPAAGAEREYVAAVKGDVTAQRIRALKKGAELEDGFARPKRVRKVRLDNGERGVKLVLAEGRKHVVFADGNPKASLIVVGEAPGAEEDATGLPFVGQAGKLLDLMLASVGLSRVESAYICNLLKCRPPGNRNPMPEEIETCAPFLERQIELVAPRAVLAVGAFAAKQLAGSAAALGKLRGRVHRCGGAPLVVTYHPAALLRNPGWSRRAWDDLQLLRRELNAGRPG